MTVENEGTIIRNRMRWTYTVFMLCLIITYPVVMWFGWAILNYPPSLVGITAIWFLVMFAWSYFHIDPQEIRFESDGLSARYQRGWRHVAYGDVVRVVWGEDFLTGGLGLWIRKGDVVVLGGLDKQLAQQILMTLRSKRPDLLSGETYQGPMSVRLGIIAEKEHLDGEWRIRPRKSRDYERHYWGYKSQKSVNTVPPATRQSETRRNQIR